jgi:hypothetical protein
VIAVGITQHGAEITINMIFIFFHILTVHLDIINDLFIHQLMHRGVVLKNNIKIYIKIYIKTAP